MPSSKGWSPRRGYALVFAGILKAVQMELSTPVKYIKRVGERVAAGLAERGIETVEDLLYHLPFRYEDRLHPKPLSEYRAGEMASIVGEVRGTVLLRTKKSPIFEMTVGVKPPGDATDSGAGDGEVPVVPWNIPEGSI